MKPIKFKGYNTVYAENQPEYISLPVYRDSKDMDVAVTSCWQFTLLERLKVLMFGKMYWQQLTFNQPLQPVKPSVSNPFHEVRIDN